MELRHDNGRNESRDRHYRRWKPFSDEVVRVAFDQITSRAHYDASSVPLDRTDFERGELPQPGFTRPQRKQRVSVGNEPVSIKKRSEIKTARSTIKPRCLDKKTDVRRALRRRVRSQNGAKQNPAVGFIRGCAVAGFLAPFVLLGIEKMRFVPGITVTNALDLYYMPCTHSLLGALFWSAVTFAIYKIGWRNIALTSAALLVGFAVFSHWLLDLIVHRPDLAIYDDTLKVGFGLWNYRGIEFVLEIGILLFGAVLYLKRNGAIARKIGIIIFVAALVLIQTSNTFVRRPPSSDRGFAITALIFYTVFAIIAFLLEKRRPIAS